MNPFLNFSALFLQTLLYAVMYLPTRFFAHFKVKGKENFKNITRGGIIIMANHASQLDPGLLNFALPWNTRCRPAYIVALTKEHYLHLPLGKLLFGGKFFKLGGAYPAYLKQESLSASLPHHLDLLKKDRVVVIFPEGGISKDGNFRGVRPGLAFLAHETNATVIPAYIYGDYLMESRDFFARKRHMGVIFGKPVSFSEYADMDRTYTREEYKAIAEHMFQSVRNLALKHPMLREPNIGC